MIERFIATLKPSRKSLLVVFLVLLFIDIFFFQEPDDLETLVLLAFWTVGLFLFKPKTKTLFVLAILSLFFASFLQLFGQLKMVGKVSGWSYVFLITGLVKLFVAGGR